jgi:hypothetical protein
MYNTGYMDENCGSMVKVPAGEFQRHIGRYQDMALTQPVAVTRNGRERTVMISADEGTGRLYRCRHRCAGGDAGAGVVQAV